MSFQEIYLFVRGPLAFGSFVIFFIGMLYQIFFFFKHTKKPKKKSYLIPLYLKEELKKRSTRKGLFSFEFDPVLTVLTTIFHVCLIVVPIFLLAHNILLEESWGFALPSFSEYIADILTIVVLVFGFFLLLRRVFVKKVRAISDVWDYVLLAIVILPFLTGFLAYHQVFYRQMIVLHIIFGEVMLVCIPFTRLRHMLFLVLNRVFIQSEYSFLKAGGRIYGSIKKI